MYWGPAQVVLSAAYRYRQHDGHAHKPSAPALVAGLAVSRSARSGSNASALSRDVLGVGRKSPTCHREARSCWRQPRSCLV